MDVTLFWPILLYYKDTSMCFYVSLFFGSKKFTLQYVDEDLHIYAKQALWKKLIQVN